MNFREALERNKKVDHLDLHVGDSVFAEGVPALHALTGKDTGHDQGFMCLADYSGSPFYNPGMKLHPSAAVLEYGGHPAGILDGKRIYVPPFPTGSEAKDWAMRDSMGSLYDPDKPRNDGPMPETEWQ